MNDSPVNQRSTPPRSYDEALRFLYDRIDYERMASANAARYPFRLQRMVDLLDDLDLQSFLYQAGSKPTVPLIHVAGTKGKGSVATMVAEVLTACGFRTGLYTSPHLHRLEERFRINGEPCSPDQMIDLVDRLRSLANDRSRVSGSPSFFEMTTAMALLHFQQQACEAVVLEVGLGGRLDSTNVCSPSLSVVTSIGLDHQHVLGDNLVQIAREKSGIIKTDVPVISGVADPAAASVVRAEAEKHECEFFELGIDFDFDCRPAQRWGSTIDYQAKRSPLTPSVQISLPLEGEHQARNASLAIAATDVLRDQGFDLPFDGIERGFSQLHCDGRIERFDLPGDVLGVLDAAHNADSIDALCACLQQRSSGRKISVVFGTSVDKTAEPMLQSLARIADRLLLTRFHGNPRFRDPQELLPLLPAVVAKQTPIIDDPIEACREGLRAAGAGGTLVVCGSFFLAAETRSWMLEQAAD
ncbi:MAG: bifunctional folylpolyglutamate synthase/dihydrofolate synthase [Rubripirellula sp.]